jgi:hypothetical protein
MAERVSSRKAANHARVVLWRKFLQWARHVVFGAPKKKESYYLSAVMPGMMGRLVAVRRNTPYAFQTWRFMPAYGTMPTNAQIFVYCDLIHEISHDDALATHRLSMVLVSPYQSRLYWSGDYQMESIAGFNNCAARVTEAIARTLLGTRYDELSPQQWKDKAQKFVDGFAIGRR